MFLRPLDNLPEINGMSGSTRIARPAARVLGAPVWAISENELLSIQDVIRGRLKIAFAKDGNESIETIFKSIIENPGQY